MAELDSTKVVDNCESGDQNSDAMSLGYETLSERLGWWKLNQEFSRRAEPWRSSAPEKLHPRLLALFSAVLDTICWCLVGIDLLYMVFALLVISATFFSIGFLCIIDGLMGGIPADSSRAFHWKETGTLETAVYHVLFWIGCVLLYSAIAFLNWRVSRETDPRKFLLLRFLYRSIDKFPPGLTLVADFALIIISTACFTVFALAFNAVILYVFLTILFVSWFVFSILVVLSSYVLWCFLLPLIVFVLVLLRQIIIITSPCSGPYQPVATEDKDDPISDSKLQSPET